MERNGMGIMRADVEMAGCGGRPNPMLGENAFVSAHMLHSWKIPECFPGFDSTEKQLKTTAPSP